MASTAQRPRVIPQPVAGMSLHPNRPERPHDGEKKASSPQRGTADCIDPLRDPRWGAFVQKNARASLFHSTAWLQALADTYQYEPVAYTTSPRSGELENGFVFCRVRSWLTGKRLVSLPFSDHCEALVDSAEDLDAIMGAVEQECRLSQWRYIEVRPLRRLEFQTSLHCGNVPYTFHQLDLAPDLGTLFSNCHKSSTQRKILRAEREGLRYREGTTEDLLKIFYRLHATTRKRHHRPPQPWKWFVNLIAGFGDALKIRVAFKGERAVAAVITIRHKETMVYKYGGSDPQFNHLGSMHFLLWNSIQEAKAAQLERFDFGRTDIDQPGLITFKKRWGSAQSELVYERYSRSDQAAHVFESSHDWKSRVARSLLDHVQPTFLSVVGRALYRHVG